MEENMANLLRVSQADVDPRVPFKSQTFYKWHSTGRMPEIFVRFGGGLFINMDVYEKQIKAGGSKKGAK
jgi:hypothetical protein